MAKLIYEGDDGRSMFISITECAFVKNTDRGMKIRDDIWNEFQHQISEKYFPESLVDSTETTEEVQNGDETV